MVYWMYIYVCVYIYLFDKVAPKCTFRGDFVCYISRFFVDFTIIILVYKQVVMSSI